MPVDMVFFGAHPDDVEWGIGGTALLLRGKLTFAIVDLTDGEAGSRGTQDERKMEAAAAAEYLGAAVRESLHLPDCGLVDSPENRRRIASVVRRLRPRLVLAPYWQDRHPDHAAAGLIVRNSQLYCTLKKSDDPNPPHKPAAFLFYPLNNFQQPSFVVDTTEVFETEVGVSAPPSLPIFQDSARVRSPGARCQRLPVRPGIPRSLSGIVDWRPLWRSADCGSADCPARSWRHPQLAHPIKADSK